MSEKYLTKDGLAYFLSKLDSRFAAQSSLSKYLPLTGGTMTGGITLAIDSSAYNAKGFIFTGGSRIGGNTGGDLGLYSTTNIYIRPSCNGSASTYGLQMTFSDFSPTTSESMSLGTSSYQYNEIRGKTLYENGTSLTNTYLKYKH